jgi:hypothetical protein
MDQHSHHVHPNEELIEDLLRQIQPNPSQRFFDRMARAAWRDEGRTTKKSRQSLGFRKSLFALSGAILLILIFIYAIMPSARVAARQVISYFFSSSSNQLLVRITPSSSITLLDFSNPSNFQLSIAEAQQISGFKIDQTNSLPANLVLIGARYEPSYSAVILLYHSNEFDLFFTQRPVDSGQDVFAIGSDATIEVVSIGGIRGEFVQGGWKAISTPSATLSQSTPGTYTIDAIWDNQLHQSTLRWQASGKAYELRASGEEMPSQLELIDWANELK